MYSALRLDEPEYVYMFICTVSPVHLGIHIGLLQMRFFIHYLLFPFTFLIGGGLFAIVIYSDFLHNHLGFFVTDMLAFWISVSGLSLWMLYWEGKFPATPNPANAHQRKYDIVFSVFSGLIVGLGHPLTLIIPETGLFGIGEFMLGLPFGVQLLIAILIPDLILYVYHRLQHETGDSFLWKVHKGHHLPSRMTYLMGGRNHLVDLLALITALSLVRMFGVSNEVMIWALWYPSFLGAVHHSNIDMRLGIINFIIAGPEAHRPHHAENMHEALNYAPVFPLWDVLFGTFVPFRRVGEVKYGVNGESDATATFLEIQLEAFDPKSYQGRQRQPEPGM